MKLKKWMIKCPMLFLLLAGWAGLTVYTWSEGKPVFAWDRDFMKNPAFTALLKPDVTLPVPEPDEENGNMDVDSDDILFEQMQKIAEKNNAENKKQAAGQNDRADSSGDVEPAGSSQVKAGDAQEKEEKAGITKFEKYKKTKTDSPYYSDPGRKALTTEYAYEKVDKGYFDDAVFIGDSRTVGMQDYSGLENAAFFAKTGMNVYEVLDDKFIEDADTGRQVSLTHVLKNKKYGKIYFMVGINELGTGNTATFQKAYERVIRKFHKWQPDAVIYIQGIIPVSEAKAAQDAIFNNININDKNVAIAELADGKDIFYLDVSGKLTDKNGFLKQDYTFDDVHMYAQHYQVWADYLMKHAVVR